MMKPKEQAQKLYDKYTELTKVGFGNGIYVYYHDKTIQCALIAVDEVIENIYYFFDELEKDGLPNEFGDEIEYWESVKFEIKNYDK